MAHADTPQHMTRRQAKTVAKESGPCACAYTQLERSKPAVQACYHWDAMEKKEIREDKEKNWNLQTHETRGFLPASTKAWVEARKGELGDQRITEEYADCVWECTTAAIVEGVIG